MVGFMQWLKKKIRPVIFSKQGITSWNKMLLFTMCVNGKAELLPSHAWTKINLSIYYVLTFTTADFIGCGKFLMNY